jgi:hypothetical protein
MHGGTMGGAYGEALPALLMALLMSPLLAAVLPLVIGRTLPRRRRWAASWFCAAYLATCFLASTVFLAVTAVARTLATTASVFWCACLVAVAWQLSSTRLRLVDRCGRLRPAHEAGARAALDDGAAGARFGVGCLRVCWAPMLMMAAAPMSAMLAAAAVMAWDFHPGRDPFAVSRMRRTALGYGAVGAAVALLGTLG